MPALIEAIERERPAVVVLCSPNNPTGSTLSLADWRLVCDAAPGLVLADQAYVEFGGDSNRSGSKYRADIHKLIPFAPNVQSGEDGIMI